MARRSHPGVHTIDHYANTSRLRSWNAGYKTALAAGALVYCLAGGSLWTAALTLVCMTVLIRLAGVPAGVLLRLMTLPLAFLLVSGLTIAVDFASAPPAEGWSVRLFGIWLFTDGARIMRALLLSVRALGAVSALYFLALTTPVCAVVGVLRRIRVPRLLVELMYLIYRFIFILMDTQSHMVQAASGRLGWRDFPTSCRTFSGIAGGLFVTSMRRAGRYFDAMTARGYTDELRFLEEEAPVTAGQWVLAAVLTGLAAVVWLGAKGGGI